jgi:glucose uptake protein
MIIVESYPIAVMMCIITMLCWGSWANTLKLTGGRWRFELFYWDYAIGVFLLSLLLAFTLGSTGDGGRGFLADLHQADVRWLRSAFVGGVIFNLSNILLVAAIDIAGMAILVAIILDALAYKRLARSSQKTPVKGLLLSVAAGVLMGLFYSFVAQAMGQFDSATKALEAGKLTPYTAIVLFSTGVLLSNVLWNSIVMIKPFIGAPVPFADYFVKGSARIHAIGILGGIIWNIGMSFSIIASTAAGAPLSYGLGQGATLIGALWGVFVWKEFQDTSRDTHKLLGAMFFFYLLGLAILVGSKR